MRSFQVLTVVVDVDGTIRDSGHRANALPQKSDRGTTAAWSEYNRLGLDDVPRWRVIEFVEILQSSSECEVILLASSTDLNGIKKWLLNDDVQYDRLFCRDIDDNRTPEEFKSHWCKVLKADIVIEDHPGIVKRLRSDGFTVLQIDSKDPAVIDAYGPMSA